MQQYVTFLYHLFALAILSALINFVYYGNPQILMTLQTTAFIGITIWFMRKVNPATHQYSLTKALLINVPISLVFVAFIDICSYGMHQPVTLIATVAYIPLVLGMFLILDHYRYA